MATWLEKAVGRLAVLATVSLLLLLRCTLVSAQDLNQHTPTFDSDTPNELQITWDLAEGAEIVTIIASDNDTAGQNSSRIRYSLAPPTSPLPPGTSDGDQIFTINATSGVIQLETNLEPISETITEFVLTILASDEGNPPRNASHVLTLIPVPVPRFENHTTVLVVDEEMANGSLVSELICTEIGLSSNSTQIGLHGPGSEIFSIEGTGDIVTTRIIDYESLSPSEREIAITATCTNRYNQTSSIPIVVIIANIDDNPFAFTSPHYNASILENATTGELHVLTVIASDRDMPNAANIIYSLDSSNDASDFVILPQSGEIFAHGLLDRETNPFYEFSVNASYMGLDGTVERASAVVTVNISDVNDERPEFGEDAYFVANITTSSNVGDLVLIVSAVDADEGVGGMVTYQLQQNSSAFEISATTGAIYITSPPTAMLHTLVVMATDRGATPLSSTASVYINVQLYHNNIVLTPSERIVQIPENTPAGSLIANVTAEVVSQHNGGAPTSTAHGVVFAISNGTAHDNFTISETTGNIFTLASLDYETLATEYDLIIQASLTSSIQEIVADTLLRVQIMNLDDNPPRFLSSLYTTAIEQLIRPNITILTVSAYDPDQLSSIQYSLEGTDSSFFQINGSTGEISAVMELDNPRIYRFSAVARDGGSEESTTTVFISASQLVSVTPTFTQPSFNFSIAESISPGTFVGEVTILTREDTHTVDFSEIAFRIQMQPFENLTRTPFHIDPVSGNISTQGILDFETQQVHAFHVEVHNNNGSVYDTAQVRVQLEDVNDNPPVFDQSLYTHVVNASLAVGSIVATLSATDRDSGNNAMVTYSLQQQQQDANFSLNSSSGEISVSNAILIPGDYYLSVVASDRGNPVFTATTTVFIAVLAVTPTDITFSPQAYDFQIVENEPPNTLIGVIRVLDSRTSLVPTDVRYSAQTFTECFSVDVQSGEVRLSCTTLDRETTPNYELVILAQVGSSNTMTRGIMRIHILDINDNAPEFVRDIYHVEVTDDFRNNNVILRVRATDPDDGDNGTVIYSIISGADIFRINSTSGEILLTNATEFGTYRLVISASDRGTPVSMSSTGLVLITMNRPIHQLSHGFVTVVFEVTENSPPGTIVDTVALRGGIFNPLDFPNSLVFTIRGGNGTEIFVIDARTGVVRTQTHSLDREVSSSYYIHVFINSTQPRAHLGSYFFVHLVDVNDNAPVILTHYFTTIDNSVTIGTVLFNITATDIDAGLNALVSFDINPQPSHFFGVRVDQRSPPLTFGEMFVTDTLIPGIYRFMLTATDSGEPSLQSTAIVEVIVQHAIPQSISFSSPAYTFSVVEETPERTVVGNLTILPETPALNDPVFVVTGGTGREFFNINPATRQIRKNHRRINREQIDTFSLDIRAYLPQQSPPLTANTTVTINVLDINDHFPRFTEGIYPSVGIDTDQLNTNVPLATVSASDMDIGSNAVVEYRIHAMEVNQTVYTGLTPLFVLNNRTGQLFAASTEVPVGVYALNISGSDQGRPALTNYAYLTILVQLPAPTSVAFTNSNGYVFRLPEHSGIITLARVMLEDIPDYLLQYVTYTAQSPHFTVALHTGDITSRQDFDYEANTEFNFLVTSTFVVTNRIPRINLMAVVNVTVEIVDINDNTPFFINFPAEVMQYEERERSEVVHTFLASDSDHGSNSALQYSIISNNVDGLLRIDRRSGQLTAFANLDRENAEQGREHMVSIQVCDQGVPRRCATNTTLFTLLDINDNSPMLISGFTYHVNERLPAETDVFSFEGTDPDVEANGTIRYLLNSANTPFTCNEMTGLVTLTRELDYEMQSSYNLVLILRDTGYPEMQTEYRNITVEVINLPDNTPQFNQTVYNTTTGPIVMTGNVLFQVQATDADIGVSDDMLRYTITAIQEVGNNGVPQLRIDPITGEVISSSNQTFITEAVLTISILVYDQSMFNLTNTTTLHITVMPQPLRFTEQDYSTSIPENAAPGSTVISLGIDTRSTSSDIIYRSEITEPAGLPDPLPFTIRGNGRPVAEILLPTSGTGLDREVTDRYVLDIFATRLNDNTRTTLVVLVTDVNDNRPVFLDANGTVFYVTENALTGTTVARANATDADTGENARLVFDIINRNHPFEIDRHTGYIRTRGTLDYEDVQSYSLIVRVRDSGIESLESSITYIASILNANDVHPSFEAPAYFGELYAEAPFGSFVLHTELRVTDADDVNNEQQLTFRVYPQPQSQEIDGYLFHVDPSPPYRVRVMSLPDEQESRLLQLYVEVTDEGNQVARVPLYISIFTSNHLVTFQLTGQVSEEELLSCETPASSICMFRETLALLIREGEGSQEQITFYNNTVETEDAQTILVGLYGWYGTFDLSRGSRGELSDEAAIQPVRYIPYDAALFGQAVMSTRLEFFNFAVVIQERTTEVTTIVTEESPTELPLIMIVGVAGGVVVAILLVVLCIVMVCVLGRRRKKRSPPKEDPYEKTMMNRFLRQSHMTPSPSSDFALQKTALETLYDEDEMLDTAQTTPWFDPTILAETHEEGSEHPPMPRAPGERPKAPLNLRATVDGDARQSRLSRHVSEEGRQYQHSMTGQRRDLGSPYSQFPPTSHHHHRHPSNSHRQYHDSNAWLPPYHS